MATTAEIEAMAALDNRADRATLLPERIRAAKALGVDPSAVTADPGPGGWRPPSSATSARSAPPLCSSRGWSQSGWR